VADPVPAGNEYRLVEDVHDRLAKQVVERYEFWWGAAFGG